MSGAAVLIVIAVLLIVVALVVYLVGTILELRKITSGLDEVIGNVGEILQKTEPVNAVVDDINANLDAGVSALEGLLVKKAGMEDAVGLVEGLYPGAAAAGLRDFPESGAITPATPVAPEPRRRRRASPRACRRRARCSCRR